MLAEARSRCPALPRCQAGAAPGGPVVGRDARACRRRGSSPGSQASREVAGQVGTVDGVGQTLAVRDESLALTILSRTPSSRGRQQ